jgi:hypothetical protein
MQFVIAYTFEPDKRDEIIKRRLEKGTNFAAGAKIISEYSVLGGGRGFVVVDADDPTALLQSSMEWSDVLKAEVLPVMDSEETMKLIK